MFGSGRDHGIFEMNGKEYDQSQKLDLKPLEKKRMKDDELVEHLHENHRIRTLKEKNEEISHE